MNRPHGAINRLVPLSYQTSNYSTNVSCAHLVAFANQRGSFGLDVALDAAAAFAD